MICANRHGTQSANRRRRARSQLDRSGGGALSQTDLSLATDPMETKVLQLEVSLDLNTAPQLLLCERPQA